MTTNTIESALRHFDSQLLADIYYAISVYDAEFYSERDGGEARRQRLRAFQQMLDLNLQERKRLDIVD